MFKKIIYAVAFFIFLSYSIFAKAEEIYYPHPIIFVHGIISNSSTWVITKPEIGKYFYDEATGECKYFPIANPYLSAVDYPNKGDIRSSALTDLKNEIDNAMKGLPEDQKKVIIVAHSMGGLVTRTLLGLLTDYKNKVDKVIFIGTPHIGSPYASAVWLLDKIRSEIIYPALADYPSFYSMNAGSRFRFSDSSSFLIVTGLPSQIYNDLSSKLHKEAKLFDSALIFPDEKGLTGSIALEQLRLNQDVVFQKTIKSSLNGKTGNINLYGRIFGNDTFLGQANYLAIPQNFKVIMCHNPWWYTIAGGVKHLKFCNSKLWGIPNLLTLAIDNFTYPPDLSITDAVNTGDGIVPQASQGAIGGVEYSITSFHVGETDAVMEESQKCTLLQAIDDPPVIKSVRAVPVDWNKTYAFIKPSGEYESEHSWYYLIFKLKDYLLADIEVEKLDLITDTETIDLLGGQDSYKPYVEFGKNFLREREYNGVEEYDGIKIEKVAYKDIQDKDRYLKLMPGEFYIKKKIPLNAQSLYIKIKNPADQYDDTHSKFIAERTFTISRPKINNIDWTASLVDREPNGYIGPERVYPRDRRDCNTPNVIDIIPHDYRSHYEWNGEENVLVGYYQGSATKDSEGMTLSINIDESPYSAVKLNTWLYGPDYPREWPWSGYRFDSSAYPTDLTLRKFTTDKTVNLTQSGSSYSTLLKDFTTWHGENDSGGKVLAYDYRHPYPYDGSEVHEQAAYLYYLKITVEPIDVPTDDILPLLGSSWDIDYSKYWTDIEYRYTHNTIVGADPTFIQPSRREDITW